LSIEPTNSTISPGGRIEETKGVSRIYLRLVASPAFLSYKTELMESPPPVEFDLSTLLLFCLLIQVLDLLVFGVIPESLLPIIAYIIVVALLGWFVISKLVLKLLQSTISNNTLAKGINRGQKLE
jgi:hypothetical protein